jgi:prepilin peptidase CpaA
MFGAPEPHTLVLVALIGALAFAAVSDALAYVIPNTVAVIVAGLFLVAASISTREVAWVGHLAAGVGVLAAGYLLFHFGLMGGGDVKLWAASALWAGLDLLPVHLVYVTLIGVAVACLLVLIRAMLAYAILLVPRGAGVALPRLLRRGEPVPYGIAIALGSILLAVQIAPRLS